MGAVSFKALAGYTETMRRWIAMFLLVWLPLQSLWAAAAPYCQHEASVQGTHLGHHEHEHAAGSLDASTADASADVDAELAKADHADCHGCHGHCADMPQPLGLSQALAPQRGLNSAPDARVPAAPVALPERPNWSRFA